MENVLATKKPKKKKKSATPSRGHNSAGEKDMEEIRKIAKAQRSLDQRKRDALADFRLEHKGLTNRLEKAGMSRDEFKQPYADFQKLADCDNDEDARVVKENQKIFLANQRKAYDALAVGGQLDWLDLVQDADKIRKLREEADKEAAEAAAANADELEETPAVLN